jgi:uncharacterized protein YxjI
MRQRWLALGDDFEVRDEQGRLAWFVDGKVLSLGDSLEVRDPEDRPVAWIRQRLLAWGPTYEIERDGEVVAVVKKRLFTFFRCTFAVDVPGPDDLEAVGDFLDHEYEVRCGERLVASVSKRWFTFQDTYGIRVEPGEDDLLVVACAVVIDECCHDGRR